MPVDSSPQTPQAGNSPLAGRVLVRPSTGEAELASAARFRFLLRPPEEPATHGSASGSSGSIVNSGAASGGEEEEEVDSGLEVSEEAACVTIKSIKVRKCSPQFKFVVCYFNVLVD